MSSDKEKESLEAYDKLRASLATYFKNVRECKLRGREPKKGGHWQDDEVAFLVFCLKGRWFSSHYFPHLLLITPTFHSVR